MAETLWNEMYIGINNANLLLNKIESGIYNGENVEIYTGEAYFYVDLIISNWYLNMVVFL